MLTNVDEEELIGTIARKTKVVAMVGLSPDDSRPSWGVARYLQAQGIRVIPVNPKYAGHTILGESVCSRLSDIPAVAKVEMVDIFRRSDAVESVVDDALQSLPDLKVVWMQLGVVNDAAARKATARGITVIQDRCPKVEFPRYL